MSRPDGAVDWQSVHGRDRHRPCDPPAFRSVALELARRGLTARDIASALGLTEAAVRQLIVWEAA